MTKETIKPPYRGKNNIWYTEALFYERMRDRVVSEQYPFDPPFSLMIERPNQICFRTTFVALNDPTGYKWAIKYLGDWEHWKRLIKCKWFIEVLEITQEELKIKTQAEALQIIKDISEDGQPAQSLVAAKYLAGFEWEKGGRGRPSAKEVQGELKRQAQILSDEDRDAERINLKVVNK